MCWQEIYWGNRESLKTLKELDMTGAPRRSIFSFVLGHSSGKSHRLVLYLRKFLKMLELGFALNYYIELCAEGIIPREEMLKKTEEVKLKLRGE